MTEQTQPTDAELKAMWQLHAADIGGIFYYARAVLAKWGTPAVAGEPFCWHWENTFNGGMGVVKKNPETLGINMTHPDHKWTALYTAPQPTQTVPPAGREPLTDAQIAEMMRDTWGCASIAPRHALEFARVVERAHGIKGASQ